MNREVLSREELKQLFKEAAREEFELIGLHADSAEARDLIRDDMRFVRRFREASNGVAAKIGYAVILAAMGVVGSVFMLGVQVKFGK